MPGDYDNSMLPRDYLKVREVAGDRFEALGSIYVGTTYLTGDGQAERYDGGFADGHIFEVTGVAPELGRTIQPRDTIEGAAPVVVLSWDLWNERFDADASVIGHVVRVNGKSSEVIGVMPKDSSFPSSAALWVANQQDPLRLPRNEAVDVQVFGRVPPGADLDAVQQALAPAAAAIKADAGDPGVQRQQARRRSAARRPVAHVVVPTHEHAAAGMQLLREQQAGRCGFVVLAHCSTAPLAQAPDGVVAVADLVRVGGPDADLLRAVVARGYVAESWETAVRTARSTAWMWPRSTASWRAAGMSSWAVAARTLAGSWPPRARSRKCARGWTRNARRWQT